MGMFEGRKKLQILRATYDAEFTQQDWLIEGWEWLWLKKQQWWPSGS